MKEFKIHLVETVNEVSQKSSMKIVTYVKRKTLSKGKANFKKQRALITAVERLTAAIKKQINSWNTDTLFRFLAIKKFL